MEEEIWKEIKGFEGFYEVSNLGRVKSLTRYVKHSGGGEQILRGRILRPRHGKKNRYFGVSLQKHGVSKSHYIHSLVAEAFISGKKPKGFTVDHIDQDLTNNTVNNLRYCSYRENLNNRSLVSQTGYVGVSLNPDNYAKKYRARIRINYKMKELGSYHTAKEAGEAYINAKNQLEK